MSVQESTRCRLELEVLLVLFSWYCRVTVNKQKCACIKSKKGKNISHSEINKILTVFLGGRTFFFYYYCFLWFLFCFSSSFFFCCQLCCQKGRLFISATWRGQGIREQKPNCTPIQWKKSLTLSILPEINTWI